MLMEDVTRKEILNRLAVLKDAYDKTLKELKAYDSQKYRDLIIPVVRRKKKTRKDIILAYVENQANLTPLSLVRHLVNDPEYNPKQVSTESSIREYIRTLIRDNVLDHTDGILTVVPQSSKYLGGEEMAKFVLECLKTKPMTSLQLNEEAKRLKIKTTANRLRGVVSKMHMQRTIFRMPSPNPHTGWTYRV